ncbi:unnamed protein product [Protopolystoma xenopodis]|uniref:Uncharacterized protein n=1 Tax=Protopolystoma xenopodis TaxID=117903 RepID=A0A448WKE4_9PLAT|nr:unnamed protein product [Protopolystoma xenopodis]
MNSQHELPQSDGKPRAAELHATNKYMHIGAKFQEANTLLELLYPHIDVHNVKVLYNDYSDREGVLETRFLSPHSLPRQGRETRHKTRPIWQDCIRLDLEIDIPRTKRRYLSKNLVTPDRRLKKNWVGLHRRHEEEFAKLKNDVILSLPHAMRFYHCLTRCDPIINSRDVTMLKRMQEAQSQSNDEFC